MNREAVTLVNSDEEIIRTPAEPLAETTVEKEEVAPVESAETETQEELPEHSKTTEEEAPSGDDTEEPALPEPTKQKEKLPKWMNNKLSKAERELQAREQELMQMREQMARMQQGQPAHTQQQAQPHFNPMNEPAPKRDNFESDEEFIDARYEYNKKKDFMAQQMQQQQQSLTAIQHQFKSKMDSAIEEGVKSYDDFEEVTHEVLYGNSIPHNRAMAEAIVDSNYKHDMLYFLGKYKEKAREIALSNPVQAVKKIAELEARFKARDQQVSKSKSPEPPEPVKTNSAKNESDLSTLAKAGSQAAFEAALDKYNQGRKNPW